MNPALTRAARFGIPSPYVLESTDQKVLYPINVQEISDCRWHRAIVPEVVDSVRSGNDRRTKRINRDRE